MCLDGAECAPEESSSGIRFQHSFDYVSVANSDTLKLAYI
jgi:hypothetical protein